MPAVCTCECRDGRIISGTAKWLPDEINRMNAFQLIQVLTEMKDFAKYYRESFHRPMKSIESEKRQLQAENKSVRRNVFISGILTALFTVSWLVLAVLEATRFSAITFVLAGLTLVNILVFALVLIRFTATTSRNKSRLKKLSAELKKLKDTREEKVYGEFRDQLLSGYVVLPDYSLSEYALDTMIHALYNHRASNISDAVRFYEEAGVKEKSPKILVSQLSLKKKPVKQPVRKDPLQSLAERCKAAEGKVDVTLLADIAQYLHAAATVLSEQLHLEELEPVKEQEEKKADPAPVDPIMREDPFLYQKVTLPR